MARKGGLGKGLDALIHGDEITERLTVTLPVGQIVANPRQPRTEIRSEQLEDLAASIREVGILQPLIVRPADRPDQYILIAGERRLRAAVLAGLESVPVVVREVSDLQQLELALIENIQREDLSPLETAEAYRQLAQQFDLTQEEISRRVGKSRAAVANTLRLLNLPERVRAELASGKISEGHARALLGLPNAQSQIAALETILRNDLNVRQTEELVRRLSGVRQPQRPAKQEPPAEIRALETRLRDHLGTRVNLHHTGKGGTLTIHFYSDEELDSLIAQILDQ